MLTRNKKESKLRQTRETNFSNIKSIAKWASFAMAFLVLGCIILLNSPGKNFMKSAKNRLLAGLNIYTEEIPSINVSSGDENPGSWKIKKSAKWTDYGKAEITMDFTSLIKTDDHNKDIILVLDTSASMDGSKLEKAKSDAKELIEYLFDENNEKDNNLAIISFNTLSNIEIGLTNNKEEILTKLNSLNATGITNYNAGLKKARQALEDAAYTQKDNTDLVLLFMTDGYPNIETPSEKITSELIKSDYPYIKMHGVQYDMGNTIIPELESITDKQWDATEDNLKNALFEACLEPESYESLEITDYIDTDYYEIDEDKNIETTDGEISVQNNKVIWNLNNSPTGIEASITVPIKIKSEYLNNKDYYPTNTKEEVKYKLPEKQEETKTSTLTPVLKNYYTLAYDTNAPQGCNIETIPSEEHFVYENVTKKDTKLSCSGYTFKGWEIENDSDIKKISDNTFKMPPRDVTIRAIWSRQSINKSMEGQIHEKTTLYKVIENEATSGGLAKEYTGEHADAYDRSGTEKIYYYRTPSGNSTYGNQLLEKFNVLFAEHCWQMLRTTDTGGVKLIYNGEPDDNGSCNSSRGTHVGYNSRSVQSLNSYYYYGTDYTYDKDSKTFKLAGDKIYEKWSDTTYETLLGKYTCKLATEDGTCSTLYYIESYYKASRAYAYTINSSSHYSQIGTMPFNNEYISPADVGYMYNTRYTNSNSSLTDSLTILSDLSLNTSYYYADSYDYGETTANRYTLTNPYRVESTSDYASLVGKYTFRSSTENYNSSSLYYIAGVSGSYMYYIQIQNGQTIEDIDKTYTFGDGYIDNGDGTYTLTNAVTYKQTQWPTNYSNITAGMYTCASSSDTCAKPYFITASSIGSITYSKGKYVYGKTFKYELNEDTGKYEYILEDTISPDAPVTSSELANHHYTCFNETGVCEDVKYIYYLSGKTSFYITIKDGKTVSTALDEMLKTNVNVTNSTIKRAINAWYKHNLEEYSGYLEDTVFCNDRSIKYLNGWNPDGGNVTDYLYFKESTTTNDLSCTNDTDRFSTLNNNARLAYPVGLASNPEMNLLNNNASRNTGREYWLGSPSFFGDNVAYERYVSNNGDLNETFFLNYGVSLNRGVRPSISLKSGTEYIDGDGTTDHPYIVDTSEVDNS